MVQNGDSNKCSIKSLVKLKWIDMYDYKYIYYN